MSQRKACYYRLLGRALGDPPKAPKVGTPLADRAVRVVIDDGTLPHPSGRSLAARVKRSKITGEQLAPKTPRKKRAPKERKTDHGQD